MKKNYFDPHTSFIELPIFKATILTSITLATIASIVIVLNSRLAPNFSFEGFNQVLTVFKVPLGILAITIPIIALLAANHRSEQTKEQMRLASENNNFSNYFKHLSEFQLHLERTTKFCKHFELTNTKHFHLKIFPNSKSGNYHASSNEIDRLNTILDEYIILSNETFEIQDLYFEIKKRKESEELSSSQLAELESELNHTSEEINKRYEKISNNLNYYFSELSLTSMSEGEFKNILPLNKRTFPDKRTITIKQCLGLISQALDFDENHIKTERMRALISFDTTPDKATSPLATERLFVAFITKNEEEDRHHDQSI